MKYPVTSEEARKCREIFQNSDVVEADVGDAVYFDNKVWQVTAIATLRDGLEYRLENKDTSVERDYFFYQPEAGIEFVRCPLCDSRTKHTYSGNDVRCKNDDCCIKEFDAQKACDSE